MFSAKQLTEEQVATIKEWVAAGGQMAEVQRRLKEEFGFNLTYMDTRFLALDLQLEFVVEEEDEDEPDLGDGVISGEAAVPTGGVKATLDQVARPGAMVSGSVIFSDGMTGVWIIDQMGRPSVDPDQVGYQPTEADLIAFQRQLQEMLKDHM